jgi:quercetin dioxygenase-like cupin family protein
VEREKNLVVEPGAGARTRLGGIGVDFKIWGEQTGGAFSIVEHPIDPRAVVPPHLHTREDEFSYVIEGELGARQGDEEVRLGPGGYLMKPRGILHSFLNPTDQPARILEIISPAGFEHCFKELGEYFATTEGQPDQEDRRDRRALRELVRLLVAAGDRGTARIDAAVLRNGTSPAAAAEADGNERRVPPVVATGPARMAGAPLRQPNRWRSRSWQASGCAWRSVS